MLSGTSQTSSPAPVHFTLRSPIVEMGRTIMALWDEAIDIRFVRVSQPISLVGEDCAVENNDPLAGFKVHARGFLVAPAGAISILPLEIDGFSFELPNGLMGHIGLCRYPEQVEVNGRTLRTRIVGAQWMSFIHTVRLDQGRSKECVESHMKVLMLLRKAEGLGVLTAISDPYRQWKRPDMSTFERICHDQREAVCSH